VILEVGLGGRWDSVNAVDSDCAVITSIALDHVQWLGPDRESIGSGEGADHAARAAGDRRRSPATGQRARAWRRLSAPTCGWPGATSTTRAIASSGNGPGAAVATHGMGYPALRGANQLLNASAAIAALEALRDRLPVSAAGGAHRAGRW
jgi:dihydrofolate synthase / folylpolyglutamate synthase